MGKRSGGVMEGVRTLGEELADFTSVGVVFEDSANVGSI